MMIDQRVSKKYTHEKLENPSLGDLVDVFEDMWKCFVFSPVEILLRSPYGDVAAMMILSSYFEAAWSYHSGEDSDKKSKPFFTKGFCQVFVADDAGIEIAAHAIYKHIRCGLAHAGMPSHKVSYSRSGAKPFYLTYPKMGDGRLNMEAPVRSIVVNPTLMYEGVNRHFHDYVSKLRAADNQALVDSFQRTVGRLWGLGAEEVIVAMTEREFFGRPSHDPAI